MHRIHRSPNVTYARGESPRTAMGSTTTARGGLTRRYHCSGLKNQVFPKQDETVNLALLCTRVRNGRGPMPPRLGAERGMRCDQPLYTAVAARPSCRRMLHDVKSTISQREVEGHGAPKLPLGSPRKSESDAWIQLQASLARIQLACPSLCEHVRVHTPRIAQDLSQNFCH